MDGTLEEFSHQPKALVPCTPSQTQDNRPRRLSGRESSPCHAPSCPVQQEGQVPRHHPGAGGRQSARVEAEAGVLIPGQSALSPVLVTFPVNLPHTLGAI